MDLDKGLDDLFAMMQDHFRDNFIKIHGEKWRLELVFYTDLLNEHMKKSGNNNPELVASHLIQVLEREKGRQPTFVYGIMTAVREISNPLKQ